ncbi:MAG TPA: Na+/H+ antiporter subunit B [Sphingobacteriaceae bacterium]|nr:Na+/H+ antiporter subunit B [Sphingobacteriaceae bacterium]
MKSQILQTATKYMLPILLLFSVFVLLRGHYHPGGGFVGGLVASIAFVLHSFSNGTDSTMRLLKYHPRIFVPFGLLIAASSMVAPLFFGLPVMTGLWMDEPIPVIGMVGSALFFDLGVYVVVVGVVLTILFTISQYSD